MDKEEKSSLPTFKVTVHTLGNLDDPTIIYIRSRWLEKEEGLLGYGVSKLLCVIGIIPSDAASRTKIVSPPHLLHTTSFSQCDSRNDLASFRSKRGRHNSIAMHESGGKIVGKDDEESSQSTPSFIKVGETLAYVG